jgi:hypothetical protein
MLHVLLLQIIEMSFSQKQESRTQKDWIPDPAGMTERLDYFNNKYLFKTIL